MTLHAADISLDQIDLFDMEFWAGSRGVREATFQVLRDTPDLQLFEERVIEGSPFPPGAGGRHFCLGEPAYLQSNFINGIKRLDCA